jgi:hypothetical protein
MAKQKSMTQRVRELIDRGYNNKTIIDKLGCKPQVVYNIRYTINKQRGLGAIGTPAPKPTEGIGAPPKRAYKRKGTGINNPVTHDVPAPAEPMPMPITMIEPDEPLSMDWQSKLVLWVAPAAVLVVVLLIALGVI